MAHASLSAMALCALLFPAAMGELELAAHALQADAASTATPLVGAAPSGEVTVQILEDSALKHCEKSWPFTVRKKYDAQTTAGSSEHQETETKHLCIECKPYKRGVKLQVAWIGDMGVWICDAQSLKFEAPIPDNLTPEQACMNELAWLGKDETVFSAGSTNICARIHEVFHSATDIANKENGNFLIKKESTGKTETFHSVPASGNNTNGYGAPYSSMRLSQKQQLGCVAMAGVEAYFATVFRIHYQEVLSCGRNSIGVSPGANGEHWASRGTKCFTHKDSDCSVIQVDRETLENLGHKGPEAFCMDFAHKEGGNAGNGTTTQEKRKMKNLRDAVGTANWSDKAMSCDIFKFEFSMAQLYPMEWAVYDATGGELAHSENQTETTASSETAGSDANDHEADSA